MNTSNSDLSIDSGASSSLSAVEDSLDRQHGYLGQRRQQITQGQWLAPELRRPTQQLRLPSDQMSSPLTGQAGPMSGSLTDPFNSGSPPGLVHHVSQIPPASRQPTAATHGARAAIFQTPDMALAQQQQLGEHSPALYRFQPQRPDQSPISGVGGVMPAAPFNSQSDAFSSSSLPRHESSTPQASAYTALGGAVTPSNPRQQQLHSRERQLNPMPPPPPAPTRPTRLAAAAAASAAAVAVAATDVAQPQTHPALAPPSLWRAAPIRSRTSDAFASPPSSSFSADLGGVHPIPAFHLPTTTSHPPAAHSGANLDLAALAAEQRHTRHPSGNAYTTPAGQAPPMLTQLERHHHAATAAAQQRYEQLSRTSAETAPTRRFISFASPDPASHASRSALPQYGAPVMPVDPHVDRDVSISVSSRGSLPALDGSGGGGGGGGAKTSTTRGEGHDQSTASYATSTTYEDTTSGSNGDGAVAPAPAPADTAQFQRWDGSAMTVPIWVVSSNAAEDEVEEWFERDAVDRFDVRAIASRRAVGGVATREEGAMNQDVLVGILETHLGLRTGLGWYGYTYRNPKPTTRHDTKPKHSLPKGETGKHEERQGEKTDADADDRVQGSRKRRRTSSSLSPIVVVEAEDATAPLSTTTAAEEDEESGSEEEEEAVNLVYDAFGRVRGTVPRMGYASRGGPRTPLPPPYETAALRTSAARQTTLRSYTHRSHHETRLLAEIRTLRDQYTSPHHHSAAVAQPAPSSTTTVKSQAFYNQLRANQRVLDDFRAKNRPLLLKGLQNALLSSTPLLPPPPPLIATTSSWHT